MSYGKGKKHKADPHKGIVQIFYKNFYFIEKLWTINTLPAIDSYLNNFNLEKQLNADQIVELVCCLKTTSVLKRFNQTFFL